MLVDRLLQERRVDVNKADGSGSTPLITACSRGMYPEIVRSLAMLEDVEVDARNGSGATALIEAARLGHVKIVDILVCFSLLTEQSQRLRIYTTLCFDYF